MTRQILLGAVLSCALSFPASVAAKDVTVSSSPVPIEVVTYRDLDLTQPASVRTLRSRIIGAVERVCNEHYRPVDNRVCTATAWSNVKPAIDRAIATAGERAESVSQTSILVMAGR
jgi:UrcA family protein